VKRKKRTSYFTVVLEITIAHLGSKTGERGMGAIPAVWGQRWGANAVVDSRGG